MQLKQKPYHLLLLAAVLLFIAGLFGFNSEIDIQLHGTYYILSLTYILWRLSLILSIIWLLYLASKNILFSKTLSWTHIILTLVACIFVLTMPYLITNWDEEIVGMPRHYHDFGQSKTFKYSGNLTKHAEIVAFILVAGQLTFLINLIIGLYRRLKRQNDH